VRVNAPEVLARELAELPPAPIKFCPIVADPYQAVEARQGLTRACLEVLAKARPAWPVLILTRAKLIERDAALLASIPGARAGFSLPTADDDVRRRFEPRAASIPERLAALAVLRAAGVRTFAVVQPQLPGPLDVLADALAAHVDSVSLDVLHSIEGAAADFADPRWPESADAGWQMARLEELAAALTARGVTVWPGELPPD
jgi:DNA repair photolyase